MNDEVSRVAQARRKLNELNERVHIEAGVLFRKNKTSRNDV